MTFFFITFSACALTPTAPQRQETAGGTPPEAGKPVSFAILEDYDKGQDLAEITRDFKLMKKLEIDTLSAIDALTRIKEAISWILN